MPKRKSTSPATGNDSDAGIDKCPRTTLFETASTAEPEGVASTASVAGELEGAAAPSLAGELEGAAAPSPSLSLYDDVLGVVFSFLRFCELTRACVCRAWRHAAIVNVKPRHISCTYQGTETCLPMDLDTFPLVQRHIREWDWGVYYSAQYLPTFRVMQRVCRLLPHLETITGPLNVRHFHPGIPDLFHRSLTRIDIRIDSEANTWWNWSVGCQVMETVCMAVPALTHLQIMFASRGDLKTFGEGENTPFLIPLRYCPQLKHVGIEWSDSDDGDYLEWEDGAIDILRDELPNLTELNLYVSNVEYLLKDPSKLKLVSLYHQAYPAWFDTQVIPLIERLTTLTELRTEQFSITDPSFLSRLPNLCVVDLECPKTYPLAPLLSALSLCTRVHTLAVCHPALTNEIYRTWLHTQLGKPPPLPELSNLTVYVGTDTGMRSLQFLSAVKRLPQTLRSLHIKGRKGTSKVHVADLTHVLTLRRLETLHLDGAFSSALDSATRTSLTPGSRTFRADCFPMLRSIQWDSD